MAGAGKDWGEPANWCHVFWKGSMFLAFAIPFVWLVGLIAGAWTVGGGEWGSAADWVQTIGSLGAIGIAVWIANQQRLDAFDLMLDQRHMAQRSALDALTFLGIHQKHLLERIISFCQADRSERQRQVKALKADMKRTGQMLIALELGEFGHDATKHVLSFQAGGGFLLAVVGEVRSDMSDDKLSSLRERSEKCLAQHEIRMMAIRTFTSQVVNAYNSRRK